MYVNLIIANLKNKEDIISYFIKRFSSKAKKCQNK